MRLNLKKTLLYLILIFIIAAIGIVVLNSLAEKKIESFLSEKFPDKTLHYESLETKILFGEMQMTGISYSTQEIHASLGKLEIQNLGYWKLLMNDEVDVEKILVEQPKIILYEHQSDSSENKTRKIAKDFLIHTIEVRNASFLFLKENKDTIFSAEKYSLKINAISFNNKTISRKIPFDYGKYKGDVKNIYYDMDQYQIVRADYFLFSDEKFSLEEISLLPKYSRSEMRKIVPYEKDMYTLNIDSLAIDSPVFEYVMDHPVFSSPLVRIAGADFEIYRDKTVTDDVRTKKMYSQMLRDLKLKLAIEKVELSNIFLKYQERIKTDRPLGTVAFYDLSAEISNLTNQNLDDENFPTTKVNVRTKFMNTTDLQVNWEFKINDKGGRFTISGNAGNIPPEAINPFFVPGLHIKAEGNLDALYFNFGGNNIRAKGDIRIDYDDFTVTVLKKNGEEKNKFLSAIANIFVRKNPKNGTVTKNGVTAERDRTKSFWNYFWSCIKKGLLKSML